MTEQARRPIIADPRRARGTFRSRALGLTALVASLGLVALGVPQAINALHMAAGEPLLLRLIYAEPRDQALAGLARHHFAIAAAWFDNPSAHLGEAQLALNAARQSDFGGPEGLRALDQGIGALGQALRLAPGEPRAWALLAQLRYLRDPEDAAVPAILARAIAAAPGDQRFIRLRVDIGLRVWDLADDKARQAIAHDARWLAQADVPGFVSLVRYGASIAAARDALASDLALRQRVEALYLQSPQ